MTGRCGTQPSSKELPIPRTIADLASDHTDTEHLAAVIRDAAGVSQTELGIIVTALSPHAPAYEHAPDADLAQVLIKSAGPSRRSPNSLIRNSLTRAFVTDLPCSTG